MSYLVADMDDVYIDPANGMNWLWYLKGKYPNFKCTLFVIPGKSTLDWIWELVNLDWVEVGIHGNMHDEKEEITEDIIKGWSIWSSIYKGPNWKVTKKEMDLLHEKGYSLAVKEVIEHPIKQWPLTDPRAVHGHAWIEADWKRLESLIKPKTEFKFIKEVI